MRSGLGTLAVVLLSACVPFGDASSPPSPSPTADPTPIPSPESTPAPSRIPSPTPAPPPTPTPDPAAMELEVTSCNGGVVLDWSPSLHPDFNHYIGLRSPEREIEPQYPPIAPAVDWGDLYATDRFVTGGFDATIVPSDTEWHYRVIAYDVDGRPVSQSNVASGVILPFADLGDLAAEAPDHGGVRVSWGLYDGVPACFSAYRVLYGANGVADTLLTSVSDPARTAIETGALHTGQSYVLRVQAVRTTTLGQFVIGETEPMSFAVPPEPSPSPSQ